MNFTGSIDIFTDGSCHTILRIGGWAAIVLVDEHRVVLQGVEIDTTHQRMELMAAIKSLQYVRDQKLNHTTITVFTDSAYLVNLQVRYTALAAKKFKTTHGNDVANVDFIQQLFDVINDLQVTFIKVKSHQPAEPNNLNREVDKLARKLVRQAVSKS